MSKLIGKYRANVIDVNDPENRGRVKVTCPKATKNNTPLSWAEASFVPGFFTLPERGDIVWIEFEEGHIDRPVWTGILPTKSYMSKFDSPDVKDIKIVSTGKLASKAEEDINMTTTTGNISESSTTGNVTISAPLGTLTISDSTGSTSP